MLVMLLWRLNMLFVLSVVAIANRPHLAKSRRRSVFHCDYRSKDHSHFAPFNFSSSENLLARHRRAVELSRVSRLNVCWASRARGFCKKGKKCRGVRRARTMHFACTSRRCPRRPWPSCCCLPQHLWPARAAPYAIPQIRDRREC